MAGLLAGWIRLSSLALLLGWGMVSQAQDASDVEISAAQDDVTVPAAPEGGDPPSPGDEAASLPAAEPAALPDEAEQAAPLSDPDASPDSGLSTPPPAEPVESLPGPEADPDAPPSGAPEADLADVELYTHAVLVADDVHVRAEPILGSESAGRLGADLQLYNILGRSPNVDTVRIRGWIHTAPWIRLRLEDGVEGYAFSAFFRLFENRSEAETFIVVNQSFRSRHIDGRVRCLVPEPMAEDGCADEWVWASTNGWERIGVLLRPNGTLRYVIDSYSGGDTFGREHGEGRFYVDPEHKTLEIEALLQVEVRYDGDVDAGRELMGCNPCVGGERRVTHSIPLRQLDGYLQETSWSGGAALARPVAEP